MSSSLTEGPVSRQLLHLSLPMVVGIISVALFNVVDTWFVGRLGPTELAAMSFTFPVVTIVGAISLGLGVGTTSVLARAIGSGLGEETRRTTTDALTLGVVVVLVFATLGVLTIDPLFRLLGATESTLPLIESYMSIWYVGMVFLVVPMIGNAAIRATGDTRTPAVVMLVAGGANALLDPLFIFGIGPFPALGMRGAALATVLGRAITLVFALYVLIHRERLVVSPWAPLARVLSSWGKVLRIGLPAALTNLAVPLSAGIVTALLATYGEDAVAAYGAGTRIEMLALIPALAMSSGLAPFVGQNWGAGRRDRVRLAIKGAGGVAFALGLANLAVLSLAAPALAALFSDDEAVLAGLTLFLLIAPLGHAAQGLFLIANSTFNAVGQPARAFALSFLRAPVLLVALTAAGGALLGVKGVFFGLALTNVVVGTLSALWLWRALPEGTGEGEA